MNEVKEEKTVELKDIPFVSVTGEVMNLVFMYLQTKPYGEVAEVVNALSGAMKQINIEEESSEELD